jgi:very-short-patch-repair endonuclease
VVEVDGWEHHRERPQFNDDRYRGLVHRARGWEVIRVSADHVYDEPGLVLGALGGLAGLARVA